MFVPSTISSRVFSKEQWNGTLLNAIFKCAVPHIDERYRKMAVARYLAAKNLLVIYMGDKQNMQVAKAWVVMDVLLIQTPGAFKVYQMLLPEF